MSTPRPASLALLAALTLAACAGTPGVATWVKADSDAENTKSELGACHALAQQTYARITPSAPPVTISPNMGHADDAVRPTDARIRQQQMVDTCMRDKGYRLEPAAR